MSFCYPSPAQTANDIPHSQDAKKHGRLYESCLHGKKKKNGKCRRAVLRVRSADSSEFFDIPDVEDVQWGAVEADDAAGEV